MARPVSAKVAPALKAIMDRNGWATLGEAEEALQLEKGVLYGWNRQMLSGESIQYLEKHFKAAEKSGTSLADWFAMFRHAS